MTVANSFFERGTKYAKVTTTTALTKNTFLILDQTSFGKFLHDFSVCAVSKVC